MLRKSILLTTLNLLVGLLCVFTSNAAAQDHTTLNLTTLRAKRPTGVFESIGSEMFLTQGTVVVKNVGRIVAEGVKVEIEIPGGKYVSIHGPRQIGPNQSYTYSSKLFETITSGKNLKAIVTCSNCR